MEPPGTPQKRKASVSYTSSPAKRARAISFSIKVSHDTPPAEVVVDPEIFLPLKNPEACLSKVPEELLADIAQHLESDQNALSKLCRVDDRCKRISRALLYKNVQGGQHWHKNGQTERISYNTTLAENTKKAIFVFGASVSAWGYHASPLTRADLVRALSNVSNVQILYIEEKAQEAIDRSPPDQQLGWLDLLDKAVSCSIGTSWNRFNHLKELSIHIKSVSGIVISSVFHLPALKVLALEGVYQTTPFENWSIPEASCGITTLSFSKALMDTKAVVKIITSMKALRLFGYDRDTSRWGQAAFEEDLMANRPIHSWKLLGDALRKHNRSLEELNLSEYTNELIEPIDHPNNRGVGTLGSFHDFPKLVRITGAIEAFLDIPAGEDDLSVYLPPQLEEFTTEVTVKVLANMAGYSSALASLRKVICAPSEKSLLLTIDEYLPFQQLRLSESLQPLEEAGVSISIVDSTYFNELTLDNLRAREKDDSEDEDSDQDEESDEESEDEE